jgi:hypothetical protein
MEGKGMSKKETVPDIGDQPRIDEHEDRGNENETEKHKLNIEHPRRRSTSTRR